MATSNKYFEVNQHSVPFAIDAMTSFGEQVFLATANGHLLTYFIKLNPKVEFVLVKHDHNFATQRIIQIEAAPLLDIGLLFSLSGNIIKIHEINAGNDTCDVYSSYKMVQAGNQTIGAKLFAINKNTSAEDSMVQLCTVAGNTIRFFTLKGNVLQQQYRRFVKLEGPPEEIMWYKSTIFIRFPSAFAIYDVSIFSWNCAY